MLLVTGDEALWPQIGADLSSGLILKQLDSIDELISSTPSGQAAIVLWDARNHVDPATVLSRLHLHSSRFGIIALDDPSSADAWTLPIQHRQIVAQVDLPIAGNGFAAALESAQEEVNSRLALLGDGAAPVEVSGAPKKTWVIPAIVVAVLAAAATVFMLMRQGTDTHPAAPITANVPAKSTAAQTPSKAPADADEKVDALVEKAQQAMLERHFIDPVAGSALSLYREVLIIDPDNGEARQGLQRLSEILITRVQSALDDRKFDVALQSLETARSIDASDRRLAALDEKIASLRAELGPAQIMAAINAQNFDRATQLIDDAARSKALPAAKLAQLRDEVHRRRGEFDAEHLFKLVEARLQQDQLIDPRNDSAAYYLDQAKQAGAAAADLQPQTQEFLKHLAQAARNGIDQRHFSDADRLLAELHDYGAPAATITALQHDLSAARATAAQQKSDQPQYLELAQARLAQGKLLEPDNDSALYYVNQLRSADPKNSGLAQISGAVRSANSRSRERCARRWRHGKIPGAGPIGSGPRRLFRPGRIQREIAPQQGARGRDSASGRTAIDAPQQTRAAIPGAGLGVQRRRVGRNRLYRDAQWRSGQCESIERFAAEDLRSVRREGREPLALPAVRSRRQAGRGRHDGADRVSRAEIVPLMSSHTATTPILAPIAGERSRGTVLCLVVHDELELRLRLAGLVRRAMPKIDADTVTRAGFDAISIERLRAYVAVMFIVEFSPPEAAAAALASLKRLHNQTPNLPIFVFARGGNERSAARAMKLGASDYWPIHSVIVGELCSALQPLVEPSASDVLPRRPLRRIAGGSRKSPAIRMMKKIAQSTAASVYLARNDEFPQPVALKIRGDQRAAWSYLKPIGNDSARNAKFCPN